MKRILIAIAIGGIVNNSSGQSDNNSLKTQNAIGVYFGVINNRFIDEGLSSSRLFFRGVSPKFQIDYIRKYEKSIFNFAGEGSVGTVKTREGKLSSKLNNLQISLGAARKIASYRAFGLQSNLFAGLQLTSVINYIEAEGLDNVDVIHVTGLYFIAVQHVQLTASKRIQFQITLPSIAFVKRLTLEGGLNLPSENLTIKQILFSDGEFRFANMAQFNAEYCKKLLPRTDFSVKYRFNYMTNTLQSKMKLYSNEMLLGLKFNFSK